MLCAVAEGSRVTGNCLWLWERMGEDTEHHVRGHVRGVCEASAWHEKCDTLSRHTYTRDTHEVRIQEKHLRVLLGEQTLLVTCTHVIHTCEVCMQGKPPGGWLRKKTKPTCSKPYTRGTQEVTYVFKNHIHVPIESLNPSQQLLVVPV